MIRVEPRPEPPDFDERVRQPGLQALAAALDPLPPHWRRCLPQLYESYHGICAYVCIRIPPAVGGRTVDHYVAKSGRPEDAYEWVNYRLACALMNSRKRDFEDVLDPFEVEDDWFALDLFSLEVLPSSEAADAIRHRIVDTIARLKLNDSECLAIRREYYDEFLAGHVDLAFLDRHSPFVAREHRRQTP